MPRTGLYIVSFAPVYAVGLFEHAGRYPATTLSYPCYN